MFTGIAGGMTGNNGTSWNIVTSDNKYTKSASAAFRNQGIRRLKKLNYNHREISAQLMRACKSRSASEVLCRAKAKVGVLKRCLGTGNYDSNELRVAIVHAQKMVDCAKLKVRNLKEEEQAAKRNERTVAADRQTKQAVRRKASRKMIELERKAAVKEAELERKEKVQSLELQRRKCAHRSEEYGKIRKADSEYIQARLKDSQQTGRRDYGGVCVELSSSAVQLSELKRIERMLQQEKQQIYQESRQAVNTESSSTADGGTAGTEAVPSGSGMESGAAAPAESAV